MIPKDGDAFQADAVIVNGTDGKESVRGADEALVRLRHLRQSGV